MKICTCCNETKPLEEFFTRKVRGNRYPETRCKKCSTAIRKAKKKESGWYELTKPQRSEESRLRHKKYRRDPDKLPMVIVRDCKGSDRKKGLENDLDELFVRSKIANGCSYCGETDVRMTLDRIDNSIGHIKSNVVCACMRCNLVRGSMPIEAWKVVSEAMRSARVKGLFGDWQGKNIDYKARNSAL